LKPGASSAAAPIVFLIAKKEPLIEETYAPRHTRSEEQCCADNRL
jgi:hypothetical protein